MNYERRIILRHSLASVVALGLTGISRFLYSAIIARRFGLEELGSANSLISQAFFLAIPLSFFAVALGKYASEFLGRGQREKIGSLALPAFVLPLLGLLMVPVNVYLGVLASLRGIQLTLRNFLYGIHRGEHYAYAIILAFVMFLAGFLSSNVFAPYLLFLGTLAVFAAGYLVKFGFLGIPSRNDMALLFSYSAFSFLGTLSGVFLIQGPYFMAELLGGKEIAGVVSAILSAAFLLTYLPQILQSAIMPLFSYNHGMGEFHRVKELAEKATMFLTLSVGTVVFLLMLVGREILSLIFGFEVDSSFYIALMAIQVYISYNPSIVALNSTAYVKRGTIISLAGALFTFGLWFLLIPTLGTEGVMLGLLGGYGVILIGTAVFSKMLLGVSPSVYSYLLVALILQSSVFLSKYALLGGFVVFMLYSRSAIKEAFDMITSFLRS